MADVIKGKRVLVTGSAGVIGLELLDRLMERGAVVMSSDRYPLPPRYDTVVTHLQRDLTAAPLYELYDFQPQIIFHLAAAFERSKESSVFWRVNWHDNVLLSHNLIDLAKDLKALEAFVFASSYLIYDPALYTFDLPPGQPRFLKEDDPVSPRNITGTAKYYAEKELEFIRDHDNPALRIVSARIYRVYGCGSMDVISRWIQAARTDQPVELYNGGNRFDYIFAGDVAEGLIRLSESAKAAGVVNLGSGVPHPVQRVVDILGRRFSGWRSRVKDLGAAERFEASCADLTKLKQVTGWTPAVDLARGMESVIKFAEKSDSP